jgi:hypothetical protein
MGGDRRMQDPVAGQLDTEAGNVEPELGHLPDIASGLVKSMRCLTLLLKKYYPLLVDADCRFIS